MKLSEPQEQQVRGFLREVASTVRGLPPSAQAQTLSQVRQCLREDLLGLGTETVEDEALIVLFTRFRVSPTGWIQFAGQADGQRGRSARSSGRDRVTRTPSSPELRRVRRQVQGRSDSRVLGPVSVEGRWLGVCAELSRSRGLPLSRVRTIFVVAGVLVAPLALIVYLGLFFEQYFATRGRGYPAVDLKRVFVALTGSATVLCFLYAVSVICPWMVDRVYEMFAGTGPFVGGWGRPSDQATALFVGSALLVVPIALLSALPVPVGTRAALSGVSLVCVLVYAALVCLSLASYLTGVLLHTAQAVGG